LQQNEKKDKTAPFDKKDENPEGEDKTEKQTKVTSRTCKPIAEERPKIELPSQKINERIQYMTDHALIGKFIGMWPTEKALHGWISTKWKPKGDITLQLGPKGFFTVIFYCLEDKFRIITQGPYFFNSVGLYLREWIARFNPDKEDLTWAPVWIRMYSLPEEYWDEGILKDIGSGLGEFIKIAEETKLRRYTSYARICVFMRLDKALPDSVSLSRDDYEWIQPLDYEHVPFRCCKCHAHGHLFRDCPLNVLAPSSNPFDPSDKSAQDGFTKISTQKRAYKKRAPGKKSHQNPASSPSTSNSYQILANIPEEIPSSSKPNATQQSTPIILNPSSSTPAYLNPKEKMGPPIEKQNDSS